jgi:FkbM family methyltransferase
MIEAFIDRCRGDAWGVYMGDGRIACRALARYNLLVDADDIGLTPNLVCDGFWEPHVSVVIERYTKPGMTAVDIGANVGYFSLLMASVAGPTGKVVSIEANPAMAGLLRQTIAMNGLERRIELHNVAAADKPGELDFYVTADRNLNGCILLDEWRERVDPALIRRVPAVAPDDLLAAEEKVDIVKVDVEGGEHLVWRGLERTLRRQREIVVVLEYNYMRHSRAGSLIPMIEAQGFPLRYIDFDGRILPIDRQALFDRGSTADRMLFLKRGEIVEP